MAGQRHADDGLRVLIVEDHFAHANLTLQRTLAARGPAGQRAHVVGVMDHGQALAAATEATPDLALVDAMRHPNDLAKHPGTLGFGGVAIAQALADGAPACRVVGYSSFAWKPVVNITFREVPNVVAVYDEATLVERIDEALWSEVWPHQVAPPDAADYASLGLAPEARLWEALRFAMARPDTWEAVTRTQGHLGLRNKTREHLNKYLRDIMPMPDARTYQPYVELLRAVAGFG